MTHGQDDFRPFSGAEPELAAQAEPDLAAQEAMLALQAESELAAQGRPDGVGKSRMPLPVVAGICFSVTAFLFMGVQLLGLAGVLPEAFFTNLAFQLPVVQIGLVLLPVLLVLWLTRQNIRDVLRLNRPRMLEVVISAAIPVILFPAMACLAVIAVLIVGLVLGSTDLSGFEPLTENSLWVILLCAALLPAVCEEVLFRGVVLRGLQKNGVVVGIVLSSVLFGLYHMDPQRFIAQALLGAVAGIVVYRSNSIFCGMVVHFTNNSLALMMSKLSALVGDVGNVGDVGDDAPVSAPASDIVSVLRELAETQQMDFGSLCIAMVMVMIFITIFFVALALPLFLVLFRITGEKVRQLKVEKEPVRIVHWVSMVPGLLVILGVYCMMTLYLAGI